MDTLGYGRFVSLCMEMTRLTDGKRGYWVSEVIRAAGPPQLFIRSHCNKPTVAFRAKDSQCASKKSSHIPPESIILNPSPPSRLGTDLKEKSRKLKASSGMVSMQKYLLCASNLSKNSHNKQIGLLYGCKMPLSCCDWHCLHSCSNLKRDLHF